MHWTIIYVYLYEHTEHTFLQLHPYTPNSWVPHFFIYSFATRQKLVDVKNLLHPEEKKLMGAGQIKVPTAGEEAEGLWGCCCQLSMFGRTERRGDDTQMCPITATLTKTERENFSSNRTRPPLINMLLTKTVLWGRSFFYFPVWGLLLWDSYKILWPANVVQDGKCPYSSLSHHFFSLS